MHYETILLTKENQITYTLVAYRHLRALQSFANYTTYSLKEIVIVI